jgi:Holliday junction resolvasome RuvABC ATP-dependent DNA helicase subunit
MVGMETNSTFDDCIGQESVKRTLSLYIDAYKETNRLPFVNLTTQKGGGKSFFARKFREGLERKDGSRPPILEVNAQTIKNAESFFEQIYPVWVSNNAFLFLDEGHNIPKPLQQIFLSVFDVKKNPVRTVEYEGVPYEFDFDKISFCMATTDQQKLAEPLRDRLRDICFEEYESKDLYEIFQNNMEHWLDIDIPAKERIISLFRGNPRDAVVKANDLCLFASAKKLKKITLDICDSFCSVMGINPFGLNHSEMTILKALALRGKMSLTNIASVTGFERSAIQRDYEQMLVKKNLMKIDGKRELTADGIKFVRDIGIV